MPKKSVQRLQGLQQYPTGRAVQVQVRRHPPSLFRKRRRAVLTMLARVWDRLMIYGDDDLFSIVWSLVVSLFYLALIGSIGWEVLYALLTSIGLHFLPPPPVHW